MNDHEFRECELWGGALDQKNFRTRFLSNKKCEQVVASVPKTVALVYLKQGQGSVFKASFSFGIKGPNLFFCSVTGLCNLCNSCSWRIVLLFLQKWGNIISTWKYPETLTNPSSTLVPLSQTSLHFQIMSTCFFHFWKYHAYFSICFSHINILG